MDYFDSEEDFSGSSTDEDDIEKDPDFDPNFGLGSNVKKKAKPRTCLVQSENDQFFPEANQLPKDCEKCGYKLIHRSDVYTHKCDKQDSERMHSAGLLNLREQLKPCKHGQNNNDIGLEQPILQYHLLEDHQTKSTVDALPSANRIPLTLVDELNNSNGNPSEVSSSCHQAALETGRNSSVSFSNVRPIVGSGITINTPKKCRPAVSTTNFQSKSCIKCRKKFPSVYDLKVHCLNAHCVMENKPKENNILPRPISNMPTVTSIPSVNLSNTDSAVPSLLASAPSTTIPTSEAGYHRHSTLSSLVTTPSASMSIPSMRVPSQKQNSIIPQNFIVNVISYVGNCDAAISTSCKKPKDCVVIADEIKDCVAIKDEIKDCVVIEDEIKDCMVIEDEIKDCVVIEDATKDCVVMEDGSKDCVLMEDKSKDCLLMKDQAKECLVPEDETKDRAVLEDETEDCVMMKVETRAHMIIDGLKFIINDCNNDMNRNSIPKSVSFQNGETVNTSQVPNKAIPTKSTPVRDSISPNIVTNNLPTEVSSSNHLKETLNETCAVEDLQGSQNVVATTILSESIRTITQEYTHGNENANVTDFGQYTNNVACISLSSNISDTGGRQPKTKPTIKTTLNTNSVGPFSREKVKKTKSCSFKEGIRNSNVNGTGKSVSINDVDMLYDERVLLEEQIENDIETHAVINRFECTICLRKFPEEKQLDDHLTLNHADEKPFQCKSCDQKYSSRRELVTHIKNICLPKNKHKEICLICGKVFPAKRKAKSKLTLHTNEHISGKRFKCKVCNRIYISWHYFYNHLKSHLTERTFECDKCDRRFACKKGVEEHIQSIHINAPVGTCDICGKSFKTKALFNLHYSRHSKDKPHKCDTCGAAFVRLGRLKIHLLKHTGEKPHMCDICGLKFRLKQNLRKHLKKHTGQKPYNCDICGRSFTQKLDVKRHMVIHSKDKPYQCSICNRKFAQKASICRHVRLVHKKQKKNLDAVNHELVNS